jgi:GNAT superfamily N-acetyltransferase
MNEQAAFHAQSIEIVTLFRIGADAQALTFIRDRTRQAQLDGNVDADRPPPGDDSQAAIAVAESGHWAGFATFYEVNDNRLWLDVLWVEKAWRRAGIAQRLLEAVRQAARERKLRSVLLGRFAGNTPMAALLERAGWPVDHVVHSRKV